MKETRILRITLAVFVLATLLSSCSLFNNLFNMSRPFIAAILSEK